MLKKYEAYGLELFEPLGMDVEVGVKQYDLSIIKTPNTGALRIVFELYLAIRTVCRYSLNEHGKDFFDKYVDSKKQNKVVIPVCKLIEGKELTVCGDFELFEIEKKRNRKNINVKLVELDKNNQDVEAARYALLNIWNKIKTYERQCCSLQSVLITVKKFLHSEEGSNLNYIIEACPELKKELDSVSISKNKKYYRSNLEVKIKSIRKNLAGLN